MNQARLRYSHITSGHCRHLMGKLCLQSTRSLCCQGMGFNLLKVHPVCCLNLWSSHLLPALLWSFLDLPHARAASCTATLLARSHSALKPYVVQGNTSGKDTAPFLCLRFAQDFPIPLPFPWNFSDPSAGEQGQPNNASAHGLQPTRSQPGLFQHIFPGSQFRTIPYYYFDLVKLQ